MIDCPICGNLYSKSRPQCPTCGCLRPNGTGFNYDMGGLIIYPILVAEGAERASQNPCRVYVCAEHYRPSPVW